MRYKAFISYSHSDERWGTRLHKRLETFRIPKRLIGQITEKGPVPSTLRPIFRDKVELSAGANLSEALQKRLKDSEFLIVLCSPNAAKSFWVNAEILYFKQHNNPDNIFAFIIDGEPYSDRLDQECFPEALRYNLGADGKLTGTRADPLAADARSEAGGTRTALLKLVSGMIGLGFDDLVRRDLQRARRRVTGITVSAISGMVAMGALTGIAMDARGEAEARKNDAEGLIEFMLTDLRDKLEPVGRLDVLDAVGQKASDYYDSFDAKGLDPDSIGRRATANHLLGDIQLRMGNINEAKSYFEPIFETTKQQYEADLNNPDRIYEHIQSVYWMAQPASRAKQLDAHLDYQETYLELAQKLYELEGDSDRAIQEMAYGLSNVGNALSNLNRLDLAEENLTKSIPFYEKIVDRTNSIKSQSELASRYNDLSGIAGQRGLWEEALNLSKNGLTILESLNNDYPENFIIKLDLSRAQYAFAQNLKMTNRFDEAEPILISLIKSIDETLRLEPHHDGLKRRRLRALRSLIDLYRKTNASQQIIDKYTITYSETLRTEQEQRTGQAFDLDWDFTKPLARIRDQMRSDLSSKNFDSARTLLSDYEDLLFLIKDRPGFEESYYSTHIFYLISKMYLNEDFETLKSLKKLPQDELYKKYVESQTVIITLMEKHFCAQGFPCENSSKLKKKDLESPVFQFFQNKYPKSAQDIRNQTLSMGEIYE